MCSLDGLHFCFILTWVLKGRGLFLLPAPEPEIRLRGLGRRWLHRNGDHLKALIRPGGDPEREDSLTTGLVGHKTWISASCMLGRGA